MAQFRTPQSSPLQAPASPGRVAYAAPSVIAPIAQTITNLATQAASGEIRTKAAVLQDLEAQKKALDSQTAIQGVQEALLHMTNIVDTTYKQARVGEINANDARAAVFNELNIVRANVDPKYWSSLGTAVGNQVNEIQKDYVFNNDESVFVTNKMTGETKYVQSLKKTPQQEKEDAQIALAAKASPQDAYTLSLMPAGPERDRFVAELARDMEEIDDLKNRKLRLEVANKELSASRMQQEKNKEVIYPQNKIALQKQIIGFVNKRISSNIAGVEYIKNQPGFSPQAFTAEFSSSINDLILDAIAPGDLLSAGYGSVDELLRDLKPIIDSKTKWLETAANYDPKTIEYNRMRKEQDMDEMVFAGTLSPKERFLSKTNLTGILTGESQLEYLGKGKNSTAYEQNTAYMQGKARLVAARNATINSTVSNVDKAKDLLTQVVTTLRTYNDPKSAELDIYGVAPEELVATWDAFLELPESAAFQKESPEGFTSTQQAIEDIRTRMKEME